MTSQGAEIFHRSMPRIWNGGNGVTGLDASVFRRRWFTRRRVPRNPSIFPYDSHIFTPHFGDLMGCNGIWWDLIGIYLLVTYSLLWKIMFLNTCKEYKDIKMEVCWKIFLSSKPRLSKVVGFIFGLKPYILVI